jgi:hypothetical protein
MAPEAGHQARQIGLLRDISSDCGPIVLAGTASRREKSNADIAWRRKKPHSLRTAAKGKFMPRVIFVLSLLIAGLFATNGIAVAADSNVTIVTQPTKPAIEPTVRIETTKPIRPTPRVAYGCKRVWRCDTEVCEWRRGCWGVYGYMEGPYYTDQLAKRQWARDGWAAPGPATRY